MKTKRPFYIAFTILVIILVARFQRLDFWRIKPVIDWDVTQYYSYLPATFLYQEYAFADPDTLWGWAHLKFTPMDDGMHTIPVKMTYGVSLFYAPFFLGSHAYALYDDNYTANGFGTPYKIGLLVSSLTFAIIGLWFFGNWLHFYVSSFIAAVVTVAIFLGTNLSYYTFVEPMSHVYGFALVSAILYFFQKYLAKPKTGLAVALALLCGLLVLIRPTNIIILLFLFITLLFKRKQLDGSKLIKHTLIASIIAALLWVPQFMYWKYMTGQWLYYSYSDEGFFFKDPEIWKGLFSYRKGWFIYSPLLFLAIPGFYFLIRQNKTTGLAILATLFVGLWVTFSWWCWWYGGSFGARSMIEYLPFMGLAIATLLQAATKKHILLALPIYVLIAGLTYLSEIFTNFYSRGIIHSDSMSKELFWEQMTSDDFVKNYNELLDPPDYEKAKRNEEF